MKRFVSVMLALAMTLTMSACGGGSGSGGAASSGGGSAAPSGETAGYQDTIVWCPRLDFITQDIHHTPSMVTKGTYTWVYDQLIGVDAQTGELVPVLCTEWEQIEGKKWKFTIREGIKFHNGDDLDAEDVKFSYEIAQDGNSAVRVNNIESMECPDPHTLIINTKTVDMDLLYKLTAPEVSILSKDAFDKLPEEEAIKIGTGAYKYGEWKQGEYIEFIANHDYWNGDPITERIVLRYIPEASARTIALQSGEVDLIQEPATTDFANIQADDNLILKQYGGGMVPFIIMNTAVEPFNKLEVRQAVASALNMEEMRQAVYQNFCIPLNNVMRTDNPYYAEVESFEHDLDKAKELLAEAGYADGFSTVILTDSQSVSVAQATIVQAQLQKIGIKVDIQNAESAAFNAAIAPGSATPAPMITCGFSGYTYGPDAALRVNFHSEGSQNYGNFHDDYVDEMLDKALAETDDATRRQMYAELQQYLVDQAVYIPVCEEMNNVAMKKEIVGFRNPNGVIYDLRFVGIPE